MSKLVRRILGEGVGNPTNSEPFFKNTAPAPGGPDFVRDFILSGLGRPEIEMHYEQVFAQKLGLRAAQCRSIQTGPLIKIEIQFDHPESSRMQLSRLYFILREVAESFGHQLLPKSALMELSAGPATLTFILEPLN
jgi:hypothetical protein